MSARRIVGAVAGAIALAAGAAGRAAAQAAPAAARTTTGAGVYTADQAAKGREVFTASCTGCHTAASHTGAAFAKWMRRPLWPLYSYVSRQMPRTEPGSLSEDEYVWVTAYLLQLNGMPAGGVALSPDSAALAAIQVDSARAPGTAGAASAPALTGSSTSPARRGGGAR